MIVKYQIVEKFPQYNKIKVQFYTDRVTPEMLTGDEHCNTILQINLPFPTPSGDELNKVIQAYAPMMYERLLHAESHHIDGGHNPLVDLPIGQEQVVTIDVQVPTVAVTQPANGLPPEVSSIPTEQPLSSVTFL